MSTFRPRSAILVGAVFLLLWCNSALAAPPLAEFSVEERFGVSHPDQIVYFDLPASAKPGAEVNLLDAAGKPVPFQIMSNGQLAVRTDLPAGSKRSWTLVPGKPPSLPPAVSISKQRDFWEITNSLIGIRVPTVPTDLAQTPCPLQGLRYRDGTWSALGPNFMSRPAKRMQVEFLDRGPLVVRVRISYLYDRALLHSARPELPDIPAGEGPYTCTIEVQAGQPSILCEEECEVDVSWSVDITEGLNPDRAQYRGHHATSPEWGHEPDGSVYQYGNIRHDALVDLDYASGQKDRWSQTTYPFMSHWDPWSINTGYYWQLYDSRPQGSGNLFGIFAGPASRLINPGLSGVSLDTRVENGLKVASLQVRFQRLMPTQYYTTHMRFGWGIFLGKKGEDLRPPDQVQGINRQMNLHSGMNLTKFARLPATYPDPPQGYGALYAPARVWQKIAEALREEKAAGGRALWSGLYNEDPYLGDILTFWANNSVEEARKAAEGVIKWTNEFADIMVNGEGIYRHDRHYFMAASGMAGYLVWIDQLLASDLTPADLKQQLKQCAALFALVLWDHDFVPMQPDCGMNWGPANMASMWLSTRHSYTLFLSRHPLFQAHVPAVQKEAFRLLHDYTNEEGACSASAHYTGASMIPILNLLQQLQMSQVVDGFGTDPRLVKYAEWEMQLMTPPEVRFGGFRKIIPVGDGSTEFSTRPGQLGTGFAPSNPALSKRLMGAWQAMGCPRGAFFGSTMLKVDPDLPFEDPRLGDALFRGWFSVLRAGWGTPDESAVFFVNGDFLTDHRHNDQGQVIIYALGAPISTDWGPIYYPRVAGGLMHNIVLPESLLEQPWDSDNTSFDLPAGPGGRASWWNTEHLPLESAPERGVTSAVFQAWDNPEMRWQRTVRLLREDPAQPVVVIEDLFLGKAAGEPMISTFAFLAQGEVGTPIGPVTPEERFYDANDKSKQQQPSAGKAFPLPAGLSRFTFTGQWGVDFDVHVESPQPVQASLGNWGHNWCPSPEQGQFVKAQAKRFEERQHILRLRGTDRIRLVIVPYRQGQRPEPLQVERTPEGLFLQGGEVRARLGEPW